MGDFPESGAQSGAPRAPADNLADADGESWTHGNPAPGSVADAVLTRFLIAWDRLSGDDRLRLVDEAERLVERPAE